MRAGMLALCIGIGLVAWSPLLPPWWLAPALLVVAAIARWRHWLRSRWVALVVGGALGIFWAGLYGHFMTNSLLPVALEQQPLWLRGRVVDLIETRESFGRPSQRFLLRVDDCQRIDGSACAAALRNVQLTAYRPLPIASGEQWRLRVKLKRPHGFANPGGFDFEAWQVQRGISGVGSVSEGERLAHAPLLSVDRWRADLRERLQARLSDFKHRDLLLALIVADGSGITREQWRWFRDTGTIHLFVVSGSHIAFTGGVVWWLASLWRRSPWSSGSRREQALCALPALLAAWLYALLAGMGLPIQRALIMFAVVVLGTVWRRSLRFIDVLLLALVIVLLIDPLAARDAGCWFSFAAVAALSLAFQRAPNGAERWRWWRAQWLIFVACLPVLMLIGGQLTLLSLPANLIAVPLTSIVTLPAAFIALLGEPLSSSLAQACWTVADFSLDVLVRLLEWMSAYGARLMMPLSMSPLHLLFAIIAVLLMMLPRGVRGRELAAIVVLPIFFPHASAIDGQGVRMTVFDVGQGLSVLIETRTHRLLYDTGPSFAAGSDAAELAVLPALRQRGIDALDLLIVSHHDSDHAGGAATILSALTIDRVSVGESLPATRRQEYCAAGQRWQWDGVWFTVLSPDAAMPMTRAGNNCSCVLRIDAGADSIVLAGDIEAAVEQRLVRAGLAPVTVLIAPHHGSRTSSTSAFIAALQPRYVIFSAGYRNAFGHPHPQVVARYAAAGSQRLNTADSGAIEVELHGAGVAAITEYRKGHRHYWDPP